MARQVTLMASVAPKKTANWGEEISREAADGFHEPRHPERLREAEGEDEKALGRDVGPRRKPGAQFLLEHVALLGDFARAIVGTHEREQDDLEHGDAGDEGRGAHGILRVVERVDQGLDHVGLQMEVHGADLRRAVGVEDGDERGEGDEQHEGAARAWHGRARGGRFAGAAG